MSARRQAVLDTIGLAGAGGAVAPTVPLGVARWAWLPIPVMLAAMIVLRLAPGQIVAEQPFLLPILNLILVTAVPLFASYLAARSYQITGASSVLLLGWATLVFGIGSALAGLAIYMGRVNLGVSVQNLTICLAAAAHFGGAFLAISDRPVDVARRPGLWLSAAYASGLGLVAAIVTLVATGALPHFVLPGGGFSPARQTVLGVSVLLLTLAFVLLAGLYRRTRTEFPYWYALSLGLLAVGLIGVGIARTVGSPVSWLGRGGQYMAGIYLLVALIEAVREAGVWGVSLEGALRESERRLAFVIENSEDTIFLQDLDLRYVWVSKPAWLLEHEGYLGRTDSEIGGPPEQTRLLTDLKRRVIETGEDVTTELSLTPRGVHRRFRATFKPWLDGDGSVIGLAGYVQDVTLRYEAELALRASEERFRTLADHISQLAWMAESDGWISWFNRRWLEYTGRSLEDMEGWGWQAVCHPEHLERVVEKLSTCFACGRAWEDTFPLRRADGSYRWFLSRALPIRGEDGQIARWFGTHTDVTEQRGVQEELRWLNQTLEQHVAERTAQLSSSNRELERRSRQLARLAGELTLAEQRERQRLAQLLHDHLQQLLVGAKLSLEVAARRSGTAELTRALAKVRGLLDESITAARSLTAELAPPILHDAGLAPALEWLARWMRDKHDLQVQLTMPAELACDREDLRVLVFQTVRELLFNVVKHAGVDAARVCLEPLDGDMLRVQVDDRGAGFGAAALRGEDGRTPGFGLLSIQERVRLLGGTVEIASHLGGGARVTVVVPLAGALGLEAPVVRSIAAARGAVSAAVAQRDGTVRILLVDDHAVVRHGLAMLLAEAPDLQVVGEASTGEEAVALARQLQPDVVLMDYSMPGMNGVEATRAITSELPGVRVIGLSMYEEADRALAMEEAGAVAYLTKSGAPEVLVARIRACAAQGVAPRAPGSGANRGAPRSADAAASGSG